MSQSWEDHVGSQREPNNKVVLPHWSRRGLCLQGAGRVDGAADLGTEILGLACDNITWFSSVTAPPAGRDSCWDAYHSVLQTVWCSSRYKPCCFLTSLTCSRTLHIHAFSPLTKTTDQTRTVPSHHHPRLEDCHLNRFMQMCLTASHWVQSSVAILFFGK